MDSTSRIVTPWESFIVIVTTSEVCLHIDGAALSAGPWCACFEMLSPVLSSVRPTRHKLGHPRLDQVDEGGGDLLHRDRIRIPCYVIEQGIIDILTEVSFQQSGS